MELVVDLTSRQIGVVYVPSWGTEELTAEFVLDGDASQVLDGNGNPLFGWVTE